MLEPAAFTFKVVHLRLVQDIQVERVHFQSQVSVFGLASKAAHKNQSAEVVPCEIVCETHTAQMCQTNHCSNNRAFDAHGRVAGALPSPVLLQDTR